MSHVELDAAQIADLLEPARKCAFELRASLAAGRDLDEASFCELLVALGEAQARARASRPRGLLWGVSLLGDYLRWTGHRGMSEPAASAVYESICILASGRTASDDVGEVHRLLRSSGLRFAP